MTETHYGRVVSVKFKNSASSFYILKMKLDGVLDLVTVKGVVAGLSVDNGTWFGFEGRKSSHPKFGEQYEISRAPVLDSWDEKKAFRALVSHGVSEMFLGVVRDKATDFLAVLPDHQAMGEWVPPHVALHIAERWRFCQAFYQTFDLLNQLAVPPSLYNQVWSMFGERTSEVLSTDPWELVALDGISFEAIDQIASTLGIPKSTPGRARGLILYSLKTNRDFGHSFVDLNTLTSRVCALDDTMDASRLGAGLGDLHKSGKLVVDRKTRPGTTAIYEPWNHRAEVGSAQLLVQRIQTATWSNDETERDFFATALKMAMPNPIDGLDTDGMVHEVVRQWSAASQISLTTTQEQGIINALRYPVSVITGLPGTGKTTSLRLLVRALQAAQVHFLLVAPTGIAAKRLHNVTGTQASTIHRAFGSRGGGANSDREAVYEGVVDNSPLAKKPTGDEDWEFSSDNPHPAQYVIVDESSMIDQALFYRLLSCTSSKCRLVMVGDAAQLPSVGPGNVLRDLIASDLVPVTSLTEIFRQEDVSGIVIAAHDIHNGQVPTVSNAADFDFRFVEETYEPDVLSAVLTMAKQLEASGDSYQIISPRHGGLVGVTNLNTQLRELLNPKDDNKPEVPFDQSSIRLGDRVMVVKNNYKYSVFNGDLGRIVGINRAASEIVVDIDGASSKYQRVVFTLDDAKQLLRLAYASTVHKCQGQEWDHIVMPLIPSFGQQLQRNLLYTAITRARTRVVLVGSVASLKQAVVNNKEASRNTLFVDRLQVASL